MRHWNQKIMLNVSLGLIAAYVVILSAADEFSQSLGLEKSVTAPVCLVFALALFAFIRKRGLMEQCGLCRFQGSRKDYLYFIPLAVLSSVNFWSGVTMNLSVPETLLYIVSMLCVGFLEEVIFRGFLFQALCGDNVKRAVFVSSVTFGMGHIVNLLNGADFFSTLLQIVYATAVGFLFTVIFYRGKSLWPCIVTHGVFNSLSVFGGRSSPAAGALLGLATCVISLGYALWILKKTEKTGRPARNGAGAEQE